MRPLAAGHVADAVEADDLVAQRPEFTGQRQAPKVEAARLAQIAGVLHEQRELMGDLGLPLPVAERFEEGKCLPQGLGSAGVILQAEGGTGDALERTRRGAPVAIARPAAGCRRLSDRPSA